MNILHLLSSVETTGSEKYAVALAEHQMAQGHKVYFISDVLSTETTAEFISYPISIRNYWQRLANILFLRRFVNRHQIDVIHTHSRAASWLTRFVARRRVAHINTVHGRQFLHTLTRYFDFSGDKTLPVCEDLATHLIEEVNVPARKIRMLPNCMNFEGIKAEQLPNLQPDRKRLTVAGRTSGDKGYRTGELILSVFPTLLERLPNLEIVIVGGDVKNLPPEVQAKLAQLQAQYGDRLQTVGFVSNLADYLASSQLVIASGRVAIETLWLERPLLAMGESQWHGLIKAENLPQAFASNFGDMVPRLPIKPIDYQAAQKEIYDFFTQPQLATLACRPQLIQRYGLANIAHQVEEIYYSESFKKRVRKSVPVFMYHKIPDKPSNSRHRIFVQKDTFAQHLSTLKRRGFTSLTFQEYDDFKRGRRPLTDFPRKPIFLTFDDGYQDNYANALPLLKKYGFKGTIFALGDSTQRINFWDVKEGEAEEPLMAEPEKQAMLAYGMEFGAHTMSHADLTLLPVEAARQEIVRSKQELERQLGKPVIAFSYPYGKVSPQVKELVRQAGYRYAVVINEDAGLYLEDDPLAIFRSYIFPQDRGFAIYKKSAAWYRRYFRWKRGR